MELFPCITALNYIFTGRPTLFYFPLFINAYVLYLQRCTCGNNNTCGPAPLAICSNIC